MKLIIDIDEDYVNIINKNGAINYEEEVIENGTPLDKIRAEIMEDIDKVQKDLIEEIDQGIDIGLQMALDTVNKYMGESEDKK